MEGECILVRQGFPKEVKPELQADGYVGYVEVKPDKKGRGIPGRGGAGGVETMVIRLEVT